MISILGDKKHCFQSVKWLRVSRDHFVIATSTDGCLSMWNLEKIFERCRRKLVDREQQNGTTVLAEKVIFLYLCFLIFKFENPLTPSRITRNIELLELANL